MRNIKFKLFFNLLLTLLVAASCTRNSDKKTEIRQSLPENVNEETTHHNSAQKQMDLQKTSELKAKAEQKKFNQIFKFLDSVEKEVFRLALRDEAPSFTFWAVIYKALETSNGQKTGQVSGYDCSLTNVVRIKNQIKITRLCEKPPEVIVEINIKNEDVLNKNYDMQIKFTGITWYKYMGPSASLEQLHRNCEVSVRNAKVDRFSCDNLSFNFSHDTKSLSLSELKVKEYRYSKSNKDEVLFSGSVYKDLLEKKKLKMTVPLAGPIKIYEKELKVIDEFENEQKKLLLEVDPQASATAVVSVSAPAVVSTPQNLQNLTPEQQEQLQNSRQGWPEGEAPQPVNQDHNSPEENTQDSTLQGVPPSGEQENMQPQQDPSQVQEGNQNNQPSEQQQLQPSQQQPQPTAPPVFAPAR